MLRKLLAAALLCVASTFAAMPSHAQAPATVKLCAGTQPNCPLISSGNPLPVSGTISATLGGFTPSASGARGTPLTVTTGDSSGNLPSGAVVIVSNVGTTNPMYCNVNGVAATTSDQLIGANSWFAFTIPAAITTLHCIATGGSTTANTLGGAGLATGAGGGGGGSGGGGAITAALGSYAAGALSAGAFATGAGVDGWDLTQGAKADAAWTTGSGSVIALLKAIATAEIVTNRAVNVAQINGVTPLMGNGVTGTGSQRVTVASDNTPFAVKIDQTTPGTTNLVSIGTNGTVNPQTAASWGIGTATQNSASATNGQLALGQFNTTPTTITTGNMSPLQMDNAGNLLVNIKAGAGSGGTAIADQAAFTQGTTSITPVGCLTITSYTGLTSGHVGVLSCTTAGSLHTTVDNSNANGSATSANSSPVVIASDQAAVAVKAASGAIASGAVASGAVASGAFASGSIGSGAVASGAIASGAFAAGSFVNATAGDPCMFQPKTNVPISTATGTVALVAAVSAKKVYICSLSLVAAAAVAVSLSEGSGATCGTSNQAGVIGVATNGTAANGLSLAANGGLTLGNGGGTIAQTATANNTLCLFQSGTVQIAGNLTFVQQ